MQRRTFLHSTAAAAILVAFRSKLSFAAPDSKKDKPMTDDPMLSPWTGEVSAARRRSTRSRSTRLQAGARKAMDADARRDRGDRRPHAGAATFENTIAALEDAGRTFDRVETIFGVWTSTMNDSRLQAVETRDGAEARRRSTTRSRRTRSSSRASRPSTTRPRSRSSTPEQQRLTVASLHDSFARARREARRDGEEARSPRSTSASRRSTRRSARTCSPTRRATRSSLDERGRPRRAARRR